MCELFGLCGNKKADITKMLREFYSHAADNPNGWGLYMNDGVYTFFDKEPLRADRSKKLAKLCNKELVASTAIAHIRLATIGNVDITNSHPFRGYDISGREWIFAHNGTIFEGDIVSKYFYEQDGETDSERVFLYLLERMNSAIRQKTGPLDEDERFEILESIVAELSANNKLNLLIFDGDIIYVHTNYKDSLYLFKEDPGVYFSSKPLEGGNWDNVPFMRLISYKDGARVREGRCHGNEYIPDPESLKALYLAYSGL